MSILKALEKRKIEQPLRQSDGDESAEQSEGANVVSFENRGRSEVLPDLFSSEEFKIGTPDSVSNEQSNSLIGTALPE